MNAGYPKLYGTRLKFGMFQKASSITLKFLGDGKTIPNKGDSSEVSKIAQAYTFNQFPEYRRLRAGQRYTPIAVASIDENLRGGTKNLGGFEICKYFSMKASKKASMISKKVQFEIQEDPTPQLTPLRWEYAEEIFRVRERNFEFYFRKDSHTIPLHFPHEKTMHYS